LISSLCVGFAGASFVIISSIPKLQILPVQAPVSMPFREMKANWVPGKIQRVESLLDRGAVQL